MRTRDTSKQIEQLNRAKDGYEKEIAALDAASKEDGVDRTGTIASVRQCLASIEKQIVDLTPEGEPVKPFKKEKPTVFPVQKFDTQTT